MDSNKSKIMEEVLNVVNDKRYVASTKEKLVSHFSSYYKKGEVIEAIDELIATYKLLVTSKKNVVSARASGIFTGVVAGVNDDYIFVKVEGYEEDFRISRRPSEIVFPKSEIVFKAYNPEGSNGELIQVLKESKPTLVGEILVSGYQAGKYEYYIKPQSKRIGYTLKLNPADCEQLVDGHYVTYNISSTKKGLVPSVSGIIGHRTDVGADITAKAIEAEVPIEFSKEALEHAKQIPNVVRKEDKVGRADYTGELMITIDGADTKDRDDAFGITKTNNILHVKVPISNLAHYVEKGSPLYNDALERGTSCYLADRVIPMFPRNLSNGICSLDPNVERLAISYEFDIDEQGQVSNFKVVPAVIKSKKAFTYDEVQSIIEGDPEAIKANEEYLEVLGLAYEASKRLSKRKAKNGELKLDSKEAKVIVDQNGHAIDVKVRVQRESERLIEDLMVATNEAGARYICDLGLPFLYRNHDEPTIERLESDFIPLCKSLGIKPRFNSGNITYEYRRIMESVEDSTVRAALSDSFLRCMAKAVYAADETGHYGLALDYYAQLTSPIRRFPDLINQYIMLKTLEFEKNPEAYQEVLDMYGELVELGQSTSFQERRADKLERDVNKMKFAELMADHVGEKYVGVISGFAKNGFYVQLPNTVEGFVPLVNLNNNGKDSYYYDEGRRSFISKRSGDCLSFGTTVEVKVRKASKSESKIDFDYLKRLHNNAVKDDKKDKKNKGRK